MFNTPTEFTEPKTDEMTRLYIRHIKTLMGAEFNKAVLYGSYARNEYSENSDIYIAIFTPVPSNEFYRLADKISEITFGFNVKYNIILPRFL